MADVTPTTTPRIADKVKKLEQAEQTWIAFEYFPPKTESGVANLRDRMQRMKRHQPLYVDVTWGAGGSTSDTTMDLCLDAQKSIGLVANMHLTCTNMPREKLDVAIAQAQREGLINILALRGDPPVGQVDFKPVETGFSCALDLIRFLKERTGDVFSISCSGYPEGHPQRIKLAADLGRPLTASEQRRASTDAETGQVWVCSDEDFKLELDYLKAKVDAGAGMIVTQMFYDTAVYIEFVDACRAHGINVPVIPGIMCVTTVGGFDRMVKFCKTRVPETLAADMAKLKDADAQKVKEFGIKFGVDMCKEILSSKRTTGLHFYTLNQDAVVDGILDGIDWNPKQAAKAIANGDHSSPWWANAPPGTKPWWL